MGTISLEGSLQGYNAAGGTTAAAMFSTPLALLNGKKSFGIASGVLTRRVPAAYEALSAIGVNRDVPKADTLYLKSDSAILVRLTRDDGAGGSVITVEPVHGLLILETPADRRITLVEVQGSGVVEYFASGSGA